MTRVAAVRPGGRGFVATTCQAPAAGDSGSYNEAPIKRHQAFAVLSSAMRYLVKAKLKTGKTVRLLKAIDRGTFGRGSIAGDEYLFDMETARVNEKGEAHWVETCFCDPPLEEERPFFELLAVKDAHARRNCRHENGIERWACCDCDCTKRLEQKLSQSGESFLEKLRAQRTG